VEEDYHNPAQEPSAAGRSEKPDPQQRVPEVEEQVRSHQIKGQNKLVATSGSGKHAVGFQDEVVDDERYKEAEQVNPVPAAQKCS
jgi:hypothetical protein